MKKSRTVVLDLSTCHILSNASKFVEMISSYSHENYNIEIIKKNWKKNNFKGVKYNQKENIFSKSTGNYLWDPSTHPDDYLDNLVFSSL